MPQELVFTPNNRTISHLVNYGYGGLIGLLFKRDGVRMPNAGRGAVLALWVSTAYEIATGRLPNLTDSPGSHRNTHYSKDEEDDKVSSLATAVVAGLFGGTHHIKQGGLGFFAWVAWSSLGTMGIHAMEEGIDWCGRRTQTGKALPGQAQSAHAMS